MPPTTDSNRSLVVPQVIDAAMAAGATLCISISGGKDSQAMLCSLAAEYLRREWPGQLMAVHAHLGRAEWPQTLGHCQRMCDELRIPLTIVRRPQGDLVQEIWDRVKKLRLPQGAAGANGAGPTLATSAPPWPSAQQRYCTSDNKRTVIDKMLRTPPWPDSANRYCTGHQKTNQVDRVLRASPWPSATQRYCTSDQKAGQLVKEQRKHRLIITAMGMRAQESSARSKKSAVKVAARLTAKPLADLSPETALQSQTEKQRLVIEWLPIFEWSVDDVWATLGVSRESLYQRQALYRAGREAEALDGWPAHPAYVFGNKRLSCALCILAGRNDLVNGARHNPELYDEYVRIEEATGYTFQANLALKGLLDKPEAQQMGLGLDSRFDDLAHN